MLLASPHFALPQTLPEALDALADRPAATVVAGGTEVLPDLVGLRRVAHGFVCLRRVAELSTIAVDPAAGELVIGAGVTVTGLRAALRGEGESEGTGLAALRHAAASLGTPQVRNQATVGGNVMSALSFRNLLPVLLALDARLELHGPAGARTVAFDGFVTGPGRTAIGPGELLTAVRVPVRAGYGDYAKVGGRNAQYVATVSVAVVTDRAAGTARLAFGNAAPVPLRLPDADRAATEALAAGAGQAADAAIARAAGVVEREARPPTDGTASAEYRRHALAVLTGRLLRRAIPAAAAQGEPGRAGRS